MTTPISNKESLFNLLLVNKEKIKAFGVQKLGVFGSFVSGKVNKHSDVDFLIEFSPMQKTFDNLIDLSFFLENLTRRKVEIVTPQSLSKYIGPHILKQTEYVAI